MTAVAVLRPRGMGRDEKAGGGGEGDGRDVGRGRILEGVLPRPARETMRGRIAVMRGKGFARSPFEGEPLKSFVF